jgi:hypothetical protein
LFHNPSATAPTSGESLRNNLVAPSSVTPPVTGGIPLAGFMQDLRYGVRLLRRQPGFAAAAILTMALGIGATTVLFSVADGVLLKPLPWVDADRLMRVTETRQGRMGRVPGTLSNGRSSHGAMIQRRSKTSAAGRLGRRRWPAPAIQFGCPLFPRRRVSLRF